MSRRSAQHSATTSSPLRRYGPLALGAMVAFYFVFMVSSLFGGGGNKSSSNSVVVEGEVVPPIQSNHELSPFHLLFGITTEKTMLKFDTLFGKAILIVNGKPIHHVQHTTIHTPPLLLVASQCGFTKQYAGLQALQDRFSEDRFEILAFPCNQFGAQEPGTDEEIASFARKSFGVTFPIMRKCDVNGRDLDPVYRYAKYVAKVPEIKWNFEKFLFDQHGRFVKHYASQVTPDDIAPDIERLLAHWTAPPQI
jgi:glutathione peroxidase